MDEEKRTPQEAASAPQPQQNEAPGAEAQDAKQERKKPPHENIVTRFYDQLNIPVKTLDIAIVVLCALILFLLLFGNKIQLGF